MAEDGGWWVENQFFLTSEIQNYKFYNILWKSVFEKNQNGGTIQDGEFLTSYFQNLGKNQRIKIIPFCKMIFIKKYSYFSEKIKGWRKIQNGGQKSR
jgi:hypothetical protein